MKPLEPDFKARRTAFALNGALAIKNSKTRKMFANRVRCLVQEEYIDAFNKIVDGQTIEQVRKKKR